MLYNRKRGQTTVFIIIGVIIVVGIVLFFILKGDASEQDEGYSQSSKINPNSYLKTCLNDKIRGDIRELRLKGGYFNNPLGIDFSFEDEPSRKIAYLCYTNEYVKKCVNHQPVLMSHLEEEIKNKIDEGSLVEKCWDSLISDYKAKNYKVNGSYDNWTTYLKRNKFGVKLRGVDLTIKKENETNKIDKIEAIEIPTKIYNLAEVAQEIINKEAEYCHFQPLAYMLINPEYEIDTEKAPDESLIYTITEMETNKKFRFAIRNCVTPSS